jgi:hypothetical protein
MTQVLTHKWLLLGTDDGMGGITPQSGVGDAVPVNSPNAKYIIVSGGATDVQIEILAHDGVTWVPVKDGLFEADEARFLEGIPKSCQIRATSTAAVIVELTK